MKKHFLIPVIACSVISVCASLLLKNNQNMGFADTQSFEIVMNSSKNKFHSYTGNTAYNGEAVVQTELGNDIRFSYSQMKSADSSWQVLGRNGYFYNTDPIHGLESVTLTFKTDNAQYKIYYSADDSFNQYVTLTSSTSVSTVFDFNSYHPNYFKIENLSGSDFNISSVNLSLSCINNYPTLNTPTLSEDKKTITYGLYPQTNVNDSNLVSALNALTPESNGWYLYEGEYYAKVDATLNLPDYTFDNGITIVEGTTYWFKCEPITWNVLSNNNGLYYVVSSVLLDAHCYYDFDSSNPNRIINGQTIYPNNYKYSDIRTWLNEDFYDSAFALGNEYIQTTTVDNSASTTNSASNSYACDNTEDKVFLPSYKDYKNSSYGFSTDESRKCKTTDWTRARGALCISYNGDYWARSPYSSSSNKVLHVRHDGATFNANAYLTNRSVRPAITLKIA